jgi:para-aminobenzoate synthetase / 4-amino-4-deoxychorismate lyase
MTAAETPPPAPRELRLDDASAAPGCSWSFRQPRGALAAWKPGEVAGVIGGAEAAVADGLHAVGFLAYEAASGLDPQLEHHPPRPGLPLAWFGLYARREAATPLRLPQRELEIGPWRLPLDAAEYGARVADIRERIADGETYQVNLTLPLRAPFRGRAEDLYAALVATSGAGFCAFLPLGERTILSASPELFFRLRGRELELRPMKGTRPRGRWSAEDEALRRELASSEKDRAENLMIVDLLRSDAGRVAAAGSVRVPRLFEIESYSTVHQMTSTVTATLREGVDLLQLLRALFPCGSITGAPKRRTMRVIRQLEDGPRGVYTGAVGHLSPDGAVFSVAIRTLVLEHASGELELGVGGGITYDSDPAAEWRECHQKAAFVRARPRPAFSLLETLRADAGGARRLEGHLARLSGSAAYFGFAFDAAEARREVARHLDERGGAGALRLRLRLAPDGALEVSSLPLDEGEDDPPLTVAIDAEPVDSADVLLYHKTDLRGPYQRRRARHPDADEVLLLNERGELTEACAANLLVRLEGRWLTPALGCGLLPGVLRAELLESGRVEEAVLRPAQLARAERIELASSLRGRRPARLAPAANPASPLPVQERFTRS